MTAFELFILKSAHFLRNALLMSDFVLLFSFTLCILVLHNW